MAVVSWGKSFERTVNVHEIGVFFDDLDRLASMGQMKKRKKDFSVPDSLSPLPGELIRQVAV